MEQPIELHREQPNKNTFRGKLEPSLVLGKFSIFFDEQEKQTSIIYMAQRKWILPFMNLETFRCEHNDLLSMIHYNEIDECLEYLNSRFPCYFILIGDQPPYEKLASLPSQLQTNQVAG